jgi:hypothetical protein
MQPENLSAFIGLQSRFRRISCPGTASGENRGIENSYFMKRRTAHNCSHPFSRTRETLFNGPGGFDSGFWIELSEAERD